MSNEETKVTVGDGKYVVTHTNGCDLKATRNGVAWRDLMGDNLVMSLVDRIVELEAEMREAAAQAANH